MSPSGEGWSGRHRHQPRRPLTIALVGLAVLSVLAGVAHGLVAGSGAAPTEAGRKPAETTTRTNPAASPITPAITAQQPKPTENTCVAVALTNFSIREKAGQVLMIGAPVGNPLVVRQLVEDYRLGAIFLANSSTRSAGALRRDVAALQRAARRTGIRLHVSVDQEGGKVQRLGGKDFPKIPAAVDQARLSPTELTRLTGQWAGRLSDVGITLDLAPVADTVPAGTEQRNPPIGAFDRQYGSQPEDVAERVVTVVTAAQNAGLLTTLKHFPGLGRVRVNTDRSARAVDRTATVDDPFLRPFRAGISAGAAAVMISSASYPALDPRNIAAFSKPVVTGLLRNRIGFDGLVVSDDLGAAIALRSVPVGARAVRFIAAGGDLVLTVRSQDAAPMHRALVDAAERSSAFRIRLTSAARTVLQSKYRAGLLTC